MSSFPLSIGRRRASHSQSERAALVSGVSRRFFAAACRNRRSFSRRPVYDPFAADRPPILLSMPNRRCEPVCDQGLERRRNQWDRWMLTELVWDRREKRIHASRTGQPQSRTSQGSMQNASSTAPAPALMSLANVNDSCKALDNLETTYGSRHPFMIESVRNPGRTRSRRPESMASGLVKCDRP
jgi:hypothetical protein